jgi:hypothetical protein
MHKLQGPLREAGYFYRRPSNRAAEAVPADFDIRGWSFKDLERPIY